MEVARIEPSRHPPDSWEVTPGLTLAVLGPKPVEVCQKRARVATRVDTGGKVQYLKDVTDQGSRREAISQQLQ